MTQKELEKDFQDLEDLYNEIADIIESELGDDYQCGFLEYSDSEAS